MSPKNLSPNTAQDGFHWMVVYIAHNIGEAHIVAGRLESEGIPAMVNQVLGASAFGFTIGEFGQIKVLVNPDDYAAALELLQADDELHALPDDTDAIIYDEDDISPDDIAE